MKLKNWFKHFWPWFVAEIAVVVLCIIWCAKDQANWIEALSISVSILLAIFAMYQSHFYKVENDKYQKIIDLYTKETNDKFYILQSNIYELQTQMLQISNEKERPFLQALFSEREHAQDIINLDYESDADKLKIKVSDFYEEPYLQVKEKLKRRFYIKNRGYGTIKKVHVNEIKITKEYTDRPVVYEARNISCDKEEVNIKSEENLCLTFPIIAYEKEECPYCKVYIKLGYTNSISQNFEAEIEWKYARRYNTFSGPWDLKSVNIIKQIKIESEIV